MATYTEGSTKIFRCDMGGIRKQDVFDMAKNANYLALSFNGHIYIFDHDNEQWIETPFLISDFRAS